MKCFDCPRLCGADRDGGAVGFCGGGRYARVAKTVEPFTYEEPCLGTVTAVFFGGCSLKCSYCQNREISRAAVGEEYSDARLAALFDGAAYPLDLVTPTHYVGAIERALATTKRRNRVIYNTSGYETATGVRRAAAFTDVFLTDFKYADNALATRFSCAPDYFETVAAAVEIMRETDDEWAETQDGKILKRGLIVRHLVLPGCVQNSLRVLDYIASALGTDTVISLMSQFTPNGEGELNRRISRLEYKIVKEHALKLGFRSGYFQAHESASAAFTPNFRIRNYGPRR